MKHYAGVDVGAKGGIAIIDEERNIVFLKPMSAENLLSAVCILAEHNSIACIEKVGAMPGQGVTSMFNFGKGAGFIEGIMYGRGVPYQLIPPQKWKKDFSLCKKTKQDSIDVCKKLFPGVNILPTERCKKDSDGEAEALLIAEFCRRHF